MGKDPGLSANEELCTLAEVMRNNQVKE